jgi:hypothetical protein
VDLRLRSNEASRPAPLQDRPRYFQNTLLQQPHFLVMLLVPWKGLIFVPPFLFQISDDVQPPRRGSLITPKFAHLLNACKVMAQFFALYSTRLAIS